MPLREYEVVPVDAENIEDGVKDKKLASLRAQGYRVVSSLGVQHRGKPCLALVMEPPLPGEEIPLPVETPPAPPAPAPRFGWREGTMLVLAILVIVGQILQFLR